MARRVTPPCRFLLAATVVLSLGSLPTAAQQPGPEDQAIDQIRQLPTIGAGDQQRIHDWVVAQVDRFTSLAEFRKRFADQYTHANNAPPFPPALATQTAAVAVARADDPSLKPELARALAQVLFDMNAPEGYPGFRAMLVSKDAATRYLCASGLASRAVKRALTTDEDRAKEMVAALRQAGVEEADPVVVGRIYQALALPGRVAEVFDAYLAILDHRLAARRSPASPCDGAEQFLYAFFLEPNVLSSLNAGQKADLARRVAVLLRIDAERYNEPKIDFIEIDRIERTLWSAEEILSDSAMVGAKGGDIRAALENGGRANAANVLQEVHKWVGDPSSQSPGALNASPWNVPLGAP